MTLLGAFGEITPAHHEHVGEHEDQERKDEAQDFTMGVQQVRGVEDVAGTEDNRDDRA
jgi:hypothetical protein